MPAPAKNLFFDEGNRARLQERLQANGRRLTDREHEVLQLRSGLLDGHHHTFAEIGDRFGGLSANRIRQLERKALAALDAQPDLGPWAASPTSDESHGWLRRAAAAGDEPVGQVIALITPGVPLSPMQARIAMVTRTTRTGDTLWTLIDSWLTTMRKNTQIAYSHDVGQYIDYCIERDLDVLAVRIQDFRPYGAWLLRQTDTDGRLYSKATRKRKIDAVSSLYKFLAEVDAIDRSPVTSAARIKHRPPRRRKALTRAQVDAIRGDVATGHRTIGTRCALLALDLLFGMGLRVSEVCDLDLDQLTTVEDDDGRLVRGITFTVKGGEEQTRGIPDNIDHDLQLYLAERPEPATVADATALLLDNRGRRLTRHQLLRLIQRAYDRGLIDKKATPHFARHTFNDRMIEARVAAENRQRALGHKSLVTTQNYGQEQNTITNDPAHAVALLLSTDQPDHTQEDTPA